MSDIKWRRLRENERVSYPSSVVEYTLGATKGTLNKEYGVFFLIVREGEFSYQIYVVFKNRKQTNSYVKYGGMCVKFGNTYVTLDRAKKIVEELVEAMAK